MTFQSLRKTKFTQTELANKLGIQQTTISMWENGKSAPRVPMIARIAEVLGVSAADIVACFAEVDDDCDSKRA